MNRPLLYAVCLAGCAAGRGTARPRAAVDWEGGAPVLEARPFAVPGERFIYEGRWMGVAIGRIVVEVGEPAAVGSRRLLGGRAVAESDGLAAVFSDLWWETETVGDLDTGLPAVTRDRWSIVIAGEREQGTDEDRPEYGEVRHNLLTAVAAIRGWDPAPGERRRVPLDIGGWFTVQLANAGGEWLPGFDRPALRYEGRANLDRDYRFVFWVSDDADRVPLRLDMHTKWGVIAVILRRHEKPDERPTRFDDGPSPL